MQTLLNGEARQGAAQLVDELLLRSSARAEWLVALVRILMISGLAIRFVWFNRMDQLGTRGRFVVEGPVLLLAFVFAVLIAQRVRAGGVTLRLLCASVVLDAMIANGTLLAGVLYPWPTYVGLLRIPDIAIVPALCLAAGLRLSVRVALLGSATTAILFACLLFLDMRINATIVAYSPGEALLYSFYFVATSALSVGMGHRAYALAVSVAHEMERAARAQSGLAAVLQDNHDLGSLLSSARINADLLSRVMGNEHRLLAAEAVEQLSGDLRDLSSMVAGTRENAYIELTSSAMEPAATSSSQASCVSAKPCRSHNSSAVVSGLLRTKSQSRLERHAWRPAARRAGTGCLLVRALDADDHVVEHALPGDLAVRFAHAQDRALKRSKVGQE